MFSSVVVLLQWLATLLLITLILAEAAAHSLHPQPQVVMMNSSSSTQSSPSFNEKSPSSLLPHLDPHTDNITNSSGGINNHNNKTINSAFNSDHHNSSLVNHNNIPAPHHLHNQLLQYQQQQQRGLGSSSPDCEGGGGDISDGNSDQGSGVNCGLNSGGYLGGAGLIGDRLFSRNNNPESAVTTIAAAASMAASLASAASSAITSTSSPSTCHQTSQQLQMESQLSSHYGACNPHGIDTILNRRRTEMENSADNNSSLLHRSNNTTCITPPESSLASTGGIPPSLSARLSSSLQANPYFNAANALSQMGSSCKLEDLQAAAAQAAAAGHQRANLYWPGIQGLISNPNIWRERLALNGNYRRYLKVMHHNYLIYFVEYSYSISFYRIVNSQLI